MANLFTSQTPSGTDNANGSAIGTATTVRFTVDGDVTGIRFFAAATVSGTYTVALYQVTDATEGGTGTLLASKVAGIAPTGGDWNTVSFDIGDIVSVTTGNLYRAVMHSSAGRYVNTLSFFVGPLTNGDIVADSNGDTSAGLGALAQGTFEENAALTFPNDEFSASCYFVDVEFTADGGGLPEAHPSGIAAAVALGTPDLTLSPAHPAGLEAAVTLGEPTFGPLPDIHPAGIEVSVLLGDPGFTVPPEPVISGGSWMGLLSIYEANAEYAREERDAPVACPNDGEPLLTDPRGRLRCPYDGWIYEG